MKRQLKIEKLTRRTNNNSTDEKDIYIIINEESRDDIFKESDDVTIWNA